MHAYVFVFLILSYTMLSVNDVFGSAVCSLQTQQFIYVHSEDVSYQAQLVKDVFYTTKPHLAV